MEAWGGDYPHFFVKNNRRLWENFGGFGAAMLVRERGGEVLGVNKWRDEWVFIGENELHLEENLKLGEVSLVQVVSSKTMDGQCKTMVLELWLMSAYFELKLVFLYSSFVSFRVFVIRCWYSNLGAKRLELVLRETSSLRAKSSYKVSLGQNALWMWERTHYINNKERIREVQKKT